MTDQITTLALIWAVYIFLFTEADKQILELSRRLKYALSVKDSAIDLTQLQAKEPLGIKELLDLQKIYVDKPFGKNLNRFVKKYKLIVTVKYLLVASLLLYSVLSYYCDGEIFCGFECVSLPKAITILMFIFGMVFYWLVSNLVNVKFLDHKLTE